MPYLSIRTNVAVAQADQQAVLAEASHAVATVLGKPERYVAVDLEAAASLRFGGEEGAAALLMLDSIGLDPADTPRISAALAAFVGARLDVPADRVYVRFASTSRDMWGWNGGTF